MPQQNNYELLIDKLDQFIRKYYVNKLIRGTLYTLGLVVAMFVAFSVAEYYAYFPMATRKLLFFTFVGSTVGALGVWVLQPLTSYFRLGRVISHEQAAQIIGAHFHNVQDKLLNVLQLKALARQDMESDTSLIEASINQKIGELEPVPFKSAINLGENKKYLRFALPPLLLLLLIMFYNGQIIERGTARIIRNGETFEREAPFSFVVEDANPSVVQFEDYVLSVKVEGEALPNEVFINVDNYNYKLKKQDNQTFTYVFKKVSKDTKFYLQASGFPSNTYELKVLTKPNITNFRVRLDYPAYTGRKDEMVENIGDLVVPEGTSITWTFEATNTDAIDVVFDGSQEATLERVGAKRFQLTRRLLAAATYKLYVSNSYLAKADSVLYTLGVVTDGYPSIAMEQFVDSTVSNLLFFGGEAADDYGISRLTFNYEVQKANGTTQEEVVTLHKGAIKQLMFDHEFDLNALGLEPGDKVNYYFEVFDNDGVHGSKSTKTARMTYELPTKEEFKQQEQANSEAIKNELEQAIKDSKALKEEIKALQNKLLQKENLDWQDRKALENLMERQKEIEKTIEGARKKFEENKENQSKFDEPTEDFKEKQDKLEELFEEVQDDEMQQLMDKIEDLLEKLDKEEILKQLDEFELSDDEQEKNYDRLLELYKQLEFENEMRQTSDELDQLAKEQEELSEETQQNEEATQPKSDEELQKKQEALNEKFDQLQQKLEELEQKGEELPNSPKMDELQEQGESVKEEQKNASDQLKKGDNQKAGKSQKKASEQMKDMANKMNMMMQSSQMQQAQEDVKALRQLLENLVNLSFDQEQIMEEIRTVPTNTPVYTRLVQDQYKLKDDFALVQDSLDALAKRVFQIETFVTEKVTDIKKELKSSIDLLEERQKNPASVSQQKVMTNVNDLALMLSEVMEQMQQQMANQMQGSQMCQSPGQGKPMPQMGQMQQQLNQKLDQMAKQMEQSGQSKGEGKDGQNGKNGKKGGKKWSKDFAEAAAQQAAIRRALQELQKQKSEQGKGSAELQKLIDEMDKAETDLVNKQLNTEMLKRQQEILTRLLKAEKAEREQEYENQRKSEIAQKQDRPKPKALEEYLKQREAEIERYRTVSPALRPYYKGLVEEYYNTLKGVKSTK